MNNSIAGLDLAKNVFHVVFFDRHFKEVRKRMLRRNQVLAFFANTPPVLTGMEACSGSSYWGRELIKLGHEVKIIAPQHVKPYVRGNKNDYNDARGIAAAAKIPGMPTVPVKTIEDQDIQAAHRMRTQCVRDRTALCNSMRGLLAEYGIVLARGVSKVRKGIPELLEDPDNALTPFFKEMLARRYEQLVEIDGHIDFYTQKIKQRAKEDDACKRLQTIPGFGPINSSAFKSAVGDGSAFSKGRDVSASLGVVPRQHSSGGKDNLLGISKRGDRYLRSLLVHGARSTVRAAANKDDQLSQWINRLRERRGIHKASVALANKMARIGWAVLHNKTTYRASLGAGAMGGDASGGGSEQGL
ncbi:Transposase [Desulfatibacillum aliphaticivorans]|uniref:Transposase n=1 Tax=Desulfatibacillum aliphaticivorans TaxID=218208 RepID=B8FE91_DESAL|nr:IS110 family transposase [Desulfatibacillum aliphaticivorans]ACL06872.1 Transposase [Desulfatibacillum aliphaticivorans]ACL06926.1 Transposase [Desulfatibacillum aliphaticivorans]